MRAPLGRTHIYIDLRFRFTGQSIIGHDYSRKPIMRCNHAEPNEPARYVKFHPRMARSTFSRFTNTYVLRPVPSAFKHSLQTCRLIVQSRPPQITAEVTVRDTAWVRHVVLVRQTLYARMELLLHLRL
jgi:hypothetical protein